MIDNVFVQCNYCKTKLRLRFQMGYFNIPFDICCPECGIHISRLRELEKRHSVSIRNASIFDGEPNSADYFADFSVELPHAKTKRFESLEKLVEMGFSPFMMTTRLYEAEIYLELIKCMKYFLGFRDSCWPEMMPLFDLYFNGKIPLTKEYFLKLSLNRNVRNAIAHFDYEFDASTQKIIFHDKHKNKENIVELYLIDLALLCYENITILVYLDELLYNLRKIDCLKRGMVPSIKAPK